LWESINKATTTICLFVTVSPFNRELAPSEFYIYRWNWTMLFWKRWAKSRDVQFNFNGSSFQSYIFFSFNAATNNPLQRICIGDCHCNIWDDDSVEFLSGQSTPASIEFSIFHWNWIKHLLVLRAVGHAHLLKRDAQFNFNWRWRINQTAQWSPSTPLDGR